MSTAESKIVDKGKEILAKLGSEGPSIFNKAWWHGLVMDWSMKDPAFKVEMFRFVDAMPCLKTGEQVARHLKEYFCRPEQNFPAAIRVALGGIAVSSIIARVAAMTIEKNIKDLARMFIVGSTPKEAVATLRKLRKQRLAFTADLLGEAAVGDGESEEYVRRYHELVDALITETESWKPDDLLDRDDLGHIPRANVSIKVSALHSQLDAIDEKRSIEALKDRLRPIFRKALSGKAFINLDMEQHRCRDLTLALLKSLCDEPEFRACPNFGIAIQTYLVDAEQDVAGLIDWAKKRGTRITVRLVKGAYWDYETVLARQRGWPIPVYQDKAATDACFERCTRMVLANHTVTRPALGSHNVRSIAHALATAEDMGLPKSAVEIQMLYGMAEPIKSALVGMGCRVRDYAPIGELIPGMAYLVRRLLENTSNESWLRMKFAADVPPERLLAAPAPKPVPATPKPPADAASRLASPFANEPWTDFARGADREAFAKALEKVRGSFSREWPLVIGGREVRTGTTIRSENPARPSQSVGTVHMASMKEAEAAVAAAREAFPAWRDRPPAERAEMLLRIADALRKRRDELAAVMVCEEAKPWREADADVCEAIDFCEYYAREAMRLSAPRQCGTAPGEVNLYLYQPRGVGLIVSPWNFPLAILTGMASAAIVAGNTVVVKPASTAAVIAARLFEALKEAGLPPGVANFLPGPGGSVGAHLVSHKDVSFVAFTGSLEVGLGIIEAAAKARQGQRHVKRVIAEMGGKNAVIVDDDADLDEAVSGIAYSAFGYAGQKCSACSRAVVLDGIYDRFLDRMEDCAKSIAVGPAEDPGTFVPPVIDGTAQKRILGLVAEGAKRLKVLVRRDAPAEGYYAGPAIFADVPPNDPIAQEEIFGPVLAVIRAKDFGEALTIANGTRYALTGGIFSRSPGNIARARAEFRVGNLYINRGITGALVERQPFGGFALSGVGSKAGGPDYLLQFLEPRTITENTMRRGFAPET